MQHHVLEGVEVSEKEADQQLRGGQQDQHQHDHRDGIAEGAFGEYLGQALGPCQYGQALAVGELE
ncbi:hypothetical protein D9M68_875150 [compost metagenome]